MDSFETVLDGKIGRIWWFGQGKVRRKKLSRLAHNVFNPGEVGRREDIQLSG